MINYLDCKCLMLGHQQREYRFNSTMPSITTPFVGEQNSAIRIHL